MIQDVHTSLRFAGDWPLWAVLLLATVLAGAMALLYRREGRNAGVDPRRHRWLVGLRSLVVFLTVLTLAAPTLQHVTTERQLGQILLAVDASSSMRLTDEDSEGRSSSRWDRVQALLFEGEQPLLPALAEEHDLDLLISRGSELERLWWRRRGGDQSSGPLPGRLDVAADGTLSDLIPPLIAAGEVQRPGTALVLITDGQHNAEGSPEDQAAELGALGTPVYTIGLGADIPPADLALVEVDLPEIAFATETVRGEITVRETMPKGQNAQLRIESDGKLLWEETFPTSGQGLRSFPFDFAADDLPPAADDADGMTRNLQVQITSSGAEAVNEKTRANNLREVTLHVMDRKRRVLLLDGRPRWESRYIHNHFDRDGRWEVTHAFGDYKRAAEGGRIAATFPTSRDDLLTYDLIILGDLHPEDLLPQQRGDLREFVEARGGGLIWVDGQRGHLQAWLEAEPTLLPIETAQPASSSQGPYQWSLEAPVLPQAGLQLTGSRASNAELWQELPPSQWAATVTPAAGAQLHAQFIDAAGQPQPAILFQAVGAGAVLYLASDELWRWRFQVADLYHQRLWMQLAGWIAAPPFQIDTDLLSIGSDQLRYRIEDQAELRVRLRNAAGNIVSNAQPSAHLIQDGETVAVVELTPDETHAGIYRGRTPNLALGAFEVAVQPNPGEPLSDLRLRLEVSGGEDRELSDLTRNSGLLQALSRASGGQYLREDQAAELPALLEKQDRKQTRIRETLLWSSWWWLAPLLTLLALEWFLRKRARLI